MKKYIVGLLGISSFLFFYSCSPASNLTSIGSENQVKMKNYSFNSPVGDDWEYAVNEADQIAAFHRQSGEMFQLFSAKNRRDTFINISRTGIRGKVNDLTRKDAAWGFMDNEFKIMQDNYEKTDYGEPELLEKDSLIINYKVLYRMKYELSCSLLPGSGLNCFSGEGHLYVYMPKSFDDNGIFYAFVIEEYGYSMFYPYDLEQISSLITSFKCDEDK